jgi:dimethylhistidine N-methyltransferase
MQPAAGTRAAPNLADLHDLSPAVDDFRAAVLEGLPRPQKEIPAKFFYDAEGSRLFEAICRLDEYYPTRTEIAILAASAGAIARHLPAEAIVIELGSGASPKIRLLLDALARPRAYVPVEIARAPLLRTAAALARAYPAIAVIPVCADFLDGLRLPPDLPAERRVAFFPGSTIGNFHPGDAVRLLRTIGNAVGAGGHLLIGVDLKKDPGVLYRAYNDAAGVTAAFNRNLLTRINRELGGTFDPTLFDHQAHYEPAAGRIEMHLVSMRDQVVSVAGENFRFRRGESIHTENSYKYTPGEFRALAARAGFASVHVWTDPGALFSVQLFRADS